MTLTDPRAAEAPSSLSTQPVEKPPARGLAAPLRRGWRQLTSMRTALLLLFLLALASVPGGFVPQRSLNPVEVRDYFAEHPTLAPVLDRLFLFDVFASPWFAAVYLLLVVSLVGCIVPRTRLHLRALRSRPPRVPARLDRLPASASWTTGQPPQEALRAARAALPRWRRELRERESGGELSAEKGYLRETGNLLFHVSLVVLLAGVAMGNLWGFKGSVLVVEGDGFANAIINYDDISPGRRFDDSTLAPFNLTVEDFRATYDDAGTALTFDADLTWAPGPDAAPREFPLRVNRPLDVGGGTRVYLIGHGYAPHVRVRDAEGSIAFDQPVPCLPQDAQFLSTCAIKVPDALPQQLGFEGSFTPTSLRDPDTGRITSVHPAPDLPVLTLVGYQGSLGLDSGVPQSVYSLQRRGLTPLDDGAARGLAPGETWELDNGATLELVDVQEWVTLQVTDDPGKLVVLWASVGMVTGLVLSLFVRRRRAFVRVREDGGATHVEVGGLARTDAAAFTSEWDALVERLRAATGAAPVPPETGTPVRPAAGGRET